MKKILLGFFIPLFLIIVMEIILRASVETKSSYSNKIVAKPALGAQLLLAKNPNINFVPLGGLSNTKTVLCKEDGGWSTYYSDRFGFPNPDSVWDAKNIDVAFVGDSYFQGGCLAEKNGVVSVFREKNTVLNLSSFGHGPLSQLGLVTEYLLDVQPEKVVLSYVPNDLGIDLRLELSNKTLRNYFLQKKQNLIKRQNEIDTVLNEFLNKNIVTGRGRFEFLIQKYFHKKILDIFRGPPVWAGYQTDYESIDLRSFENYSKILRMIKDMVHAWGGEVFIVFIPDAYFLSEIDKDKKEMFLFHLTEAVENNGIRLINLEEMFNEDENPFDYYAPVSNFYGHFNVKGARRAHSYIYKSIFLKK